MFFQGKPVPGEKEINTLTQKAIFLMLLDLNNVINPKFHFKVLPLEGEV